LKFGFRDAAAETAELVAEAEAASVDVADSMLNVVDKMVSRSNTT
jgi:hypothetical protein